jgi:hypothetical protein
MGNKKGLEGLIERFSDFQDAQVRIGKGGRITICWTLSFWRCVR